MKTRSRLYQDVIKKSQENAVPDCNSNSLHNTADQNTSQLPCDAVIKIEPVEDSTEYQDFDCTELNLKEEVHRHLDSDPLEMIGNCKNELKKKKDSFNKIRQCHLCKFNCRLAKKWSRHMKVKHKKFSCNLCVYSTNSERKFDSHTIRHTCDRPAKCQFCPATFKSYGKLNRHLILHSLSEKFSCSLCSFSTIHANNLKQHAMIHANIRPLKCNMCSYSTRQSLSLKIHKSRHTGEKAYSCDKCDFTSRFPNSLRRHKITHTDAKPFSCTKCDFRTKVRVGLKRHMLRRHKEPDQYKCSVCPYASNESWLAKCHEIRHESARPYSCNECTFTAKLKNDLRSHVKMHEKKRPYSCGICEYRCNFIQSLRKHEMKHMTLEERMKIIIAKQRVRKYVCNVCAAAYKSFGCFTRHQLTHKE